MRSAVDAAIGFYAAKDYATGQDAVTRALVPASDDREQTAIQRTMLRSCGAAPESRTEGLAHFRHRGLADVFFEIGECGAAIPYYEKAIEKTTSDGSRKDCEQRPGEAKRLVDGT